MNKSEGRVESMNRFTDVVDKFLKHMEAIDRSPETISGYTKDLTAFDRFLERKNNGPVYIDEVTVGDIEIFLEELKKTRAGSGQPFSKTVHPAFLLCLCVQERVCEAKHCTFCGTA